jgi:hypothetical protein
VTNPLRGSPVVYQPAYETPEQDEEKTVTEMVQTLHKISQTVYRDEGHAYRSVHAKSHGILQGELKVLEGLPDELAQGVFARPSSYPVIMRLSTVPGDLLDDSVSTPRGLAIKMIGVKGSRLSGTQGEGTQDFLMVNGPVFSAPTASKFLSNLKLLAATTDKAPGLKKVVSATLRGVESLVEKAGSESATLKALGGHPQTHILGETFYTQVPTLYGPYMAKYSIAPASSELKALKNLHLDVRHESNGLRKAVIEHFARFGGVWDLKVQLCTDLKTMPIEDASVQWPEEASPYITVAQILAAPQSAWNDARSAMVDDAMSFSPWHGLAAHRPIGSIMRVRRAAYEMAAQFRSERNASPVAEPVMPVALP